MNGSVVAHRGGCAPFVVHTPSGGRALSVVHSPSVGGRRHQSSSCGHGLSVVHAGWLCAF